MNPSAQEAYLASANIWFFHSSYIEKEEKRRADVGIDTNAAPLGLTDNTDLIQKGKLSFRIMIYLIIRFDHL